MRAVEKVNGSRWVFGWGEGKALCARVWCVTSDRKGVRLCVTECAG